jgi:hypothetical protein
MVSEYYLLREELTGILYAQMKMLSKEFRRISKSCMKMYSSGVPLCI